MEKEKLEKFRRMLEELKKQIQSKSKYTVKDFELPEEERADELDIATSDKFRQLESFVMSGNVEKLKLIEEALEKIQTGEYGYCEECGGEIGEERLEREPYAKYCVDCQEKFESQQQMISIAMKEEEPLSPIAPQIEDMEQLETEIEKFGTKEEEEEEEEEAKETQVDEEAVSELTAGTEGIEEESLSDEAMSEIESDINETISEEEGTTEEESYEELFEEEEEEEKPKRGRRKRKEKEKKKSSKSARGKKSKK